MLTKMTAEEAALRAELDRAVRRVEREVRRCPALDELPYRPSAEAAAAVENTNCALKDAEQVVDLLERLTNTTQEAVRLVACARLGIATIREVLTMLCAELDARAA